MPNISFGGLASGLDSQALIQQLLSIESRPITLLNQKRGTLQSQGAAYKDLNTRFSALETAAFDLSKISSLVAREAKSSKPDNLLATANANASPGSYQVSVIRLATASRLQTSNGTGQGNSLGGIADKTTFSGQSINAINTNNKLSEDVSSGTFFVNGQSISVNLSDKLDDVLANISSATAGAVTGQLVEDAAKGGLVLELSSTSPISLSNGTSNFLSAFKLDTATYSASKLSSSDAVNSVQTNLKLDGSEGGVNLAQTVGSGSLTINGKAINYDSTKDNINDLVKRINDAEAGVRASFSTAGGGRLNLVASANGPLAIQVSDSGTLADALGLRSASSSSLGQSAQIQIDGGAVQSFNKNTGIQAAGLEGVLLDLKNADTLNPVTLTVNADSSGAIEKVQKFVDQFNSVVGRIDELTAYNASTGQKGLFLSDFSVKAAKQRLFEQLFSRVSGLDGANGSGSLAELGLSTGALGATPGTTSKLVFDSSKLQAALNNDPNRVAQLLGAQENAAGTNVGVITRVKDYLDNLSSSTGVFAQKQKTTTSQIENIDNRIDTLNQRLSRKEKLYQAQFTGLEKAISRMQAQQNSMSALFNR